MAEPFANPKQLTFVVTMESIYKVESATKTVSITLHAFASKSETSKLSAHKPLKVESLVIGP